ncbi:hypothetical protein DL769_009673 [Monosporascus sp. CRB-8-3]|nr:hypothetical protein DL769_009673 [Monosporascus sp. CRB-8-3]
MVVLSENNGPRGAGRPARQQVQDDLVMATNSSSIVSKRSVERIYYPDEPHFFRFFVKKFQRRAPLINRGYHLRMHIIDVAVRRFLQRPSQRKKVIVNLGCGSDVLPWQCLTRYPDHCHHAKFVDIDFPDLMTKKSRIVQETSELLSPLSGIKTAAERHLLFQSDKYAQIGCDLRDLANIERSLSALVSLPDSEFLFVAEVSITYMETEAADGVIRWASSLGQAEFCLLEQIVPDGPDHPFAKTMLRHFEKLKTPLKSVSTYPDLEAQRNRFYRLGWAYTDVESLWQAWSNNQWLSPDERKMLDRIEPFDEWEEFALFASHYCILIAKTDAACSASGLNYRILAAYHPAISRDSSPIPRPLLTGVSAFIDRGGSLVIMGGGATCFSMGTYWNEGCYSVVHILGNLNKGYTPPNASNGQWNFSRTLEVTEEPRPQREQVTIHKAIHSKMDFNAKNFAYVTVPFGDFMQSVSEGNKMYLRALSEDHPAEQPANLTTDFPQLADDFQLPEELSFVTENAFSSVLRISGPVNMWLHYDVMANVYCQVVGSSSSSVDVFSELKSSSISLAQTHPHEAVLNPGDILFLPPLWLHTAAPLTDLGVAVNIFFRNLESGYSSGRDVYGNRDLAGYEKGRQDKSVE